MARNRLAPVVAGAVAAMAVLIVVVAVVIFVSAGPESDPATTRHDPRRCPPADDEGVIVLILPSDSGEELCHYIERLSGRDVSPPFDIPALPVDAIG